MSDSNKTEPFAATGSGKSEAEVAFELVSKLKGQGVWGEKNMPQILDMYAECLDAVKGLRAYSGQRRVYSPVHMNSGSSLPERQTSVQAAAPTMNATTPQAAPPAAPATTPATTPVGQNTPSASVAPPPFPAQATGHGQVAPPNPVHDQMQQIKQVMKI